MSECLAVFGVIAGVAVIVFKVGRKSVPVNVAVQLEVLDADTEHDQCWSDFTRVHVLPRHHYSGGVIFQKVQIKLDMHACCLNY